MGYNTHYRIQAVDATSHEPVSREFLECLTFCNQPADLWSFNGEAPYTLFGGEPATWYEHDIEMLGLSKQYHGVVFILDGDGEDAGDVWRKFFLNGNVHEWEAEIERPEFDDSILSWLNLNE